MLDDQNNVFNLSTFYEDAVGRYYNVSSEHASEAAAMRHMYKITRESITSDEEIDPGDKDRIVNLTIDKINIRYNLYKLYVDHFFPFVSTPDYEALAIAVICDEETDDINGPIMKPNKNPDFEMPRMEDLLIPDNDNQRADGTDQTYDNDDGEDITYRNDGFDQDLVDRAQTIYSDACTLEQYGLMDEDEMPSPEALFLAHINFWQGLVEIDQTLAEKSDEELKKILNKDLQQLDEFLCPHTRIGEDLKKFYDQVEQRILDRVVMKPSELPYSYLSPVPKGPE